LKKERQSERDGGPLIPYRMIPEVYRAGCTFCTSSLSSPKLEVYDGSYLAAGSARKV